MNLQCDELHPNWRALATIHLPLKRFIKAGEQSLANGVTNKDGHGYKIEGVDGTEVKEFYEELIKEKSNIITKHNTGKTKRILEPKKELRKSKILFDKNKFFRCAVENDTKTLKQFEFKNDDINSRDNYGWTALMMASCENALRTVSFLLIMGADSNATEKSGKSALEIAKQKGNHDIVKILENKETLKKDLVPALSNIRIEKETKTASKPFYCDSCQQSFTESTFAEHQTSTVHQFNLKSTQTPNKLQRFNISNKNRGLQLMVKQGWDKESGLGPSQSGRLYPVKTVIRKQRTGLGIEQEPARVTHYEAFDERAVKRQSSDYYKKKSRNRNDINREKIRDWKRTKRLRHELTKMSKADEQKTIEIIKSTEEVADKILVIKHELIQLDKRRQQTREAIREAEKNCDEKKMYITVGSMLIKMEREKALKLLKNDQTQIEKEMNVLRSEQKILVNKHRDLEHFAPYTGTNLNPLSHKEFHALKANLPML